MYEKIKLFHTVNNLLETLGNSSEKHNEKSFGPLFVLFIKNVAWKRNTMKT